MAVFCMGFVLFYRESQTKRPGLDMRIVFGALKTWRLAAIGATSSSFETYSFFETGNYPGLLSVFLSTFLVTSTLSQANYVIITSCSYQLSIKGPNSIINNAVFYCTKKIGVKTLSRVMAKINVIQ